MRIIIPALALSVLGASYAQAGGGYTIEDYNASLVDYGIPFYERYPASFYTGFAPRVEEPKRIHFRAGRGNQVRLTAILDEYSILTYLYGLQKRYDVYARAEAAGMLQMKGTQQLDAFRKIVDSPAYDISGKTAAHDGGQMSRPELYAASLEVITALNPGRMFPLTLDLREAFLSWRGDIQKFASVYKDDPADIELIKQYLFHGDDVVVLTNEMLFGRVNAVYLNNFQVAKLAKIVSQVLTEPDNDKAFLFLARDYFEDVTQGKYDFRVVAGGEFVPALQCDRPQESCTLSYHEFTAVYPNGSVVGSARDRKGNKIHAIRNNALMTFLERPYHAVDHIRSQGYYGYAPKMDWQGIGNGIHNPGVSHYLVGGKHLYKELNIPEEYQFLWVVSRGPVSHGCVRMSVGHLWEVRQVFPSDTVRMREVHYFGNRSSDYDIYDIDGDGTPEVMGSEYMIAYSVKGASGDARRKGKNFSTEGVTKDDFYKNLYGEKGQYKQVGDRYVFDNPHISHFRKSKADDRDGAVISQPLEGSFTLYEQAYEKDKAQVYLPPGKYQRQLSIKNNNKSSGKQMVRVLGRITACGPFKDEWSYCYEPAFDQEFEALTSLL